ncbi:MAG: Gfo/Idh/MocA family oxidoreductase [Bacteroidales bacterium]|nr:Gfo/Idh/MocA family oxidoreductase [Bacteroidales bacterium]
MKRRKFFENSSKVLVASAILPLNTMAANSFGAATKKIKVALVGTGSRGSQTWGKSLLDGYSKWVEMVGLCDINHKRMEYAKKFMGASGAKTYEAKDFDLMIKETQPDTVIVTTTDSFHVDYIVRAMELGVDVISEKPIATEVEQCQRILDTEYKTGQKVTVGFNMRFGNYSPEMKKVLDSGELGKILSVDFQEYLDLNHGASYFRRWHGKNKYSGSLLVHKASHHFDLVNWLIDADPVEVQAMGKVAFYGHNNSFRGRNCRTCAFADKCDFYWDMTTSERMMDLYAKCEDVDGYFRDGCVWDNEIDSYDTSTTQVTYDNGALLTYSQNTNLPYEGQYISFTGEKGRMDVRLFGRQPWEEKAPIEIRISKDTKTSKIYTLDNSTGEHGGSDDRVKDLIFNPDVQDKLNQRAGSRAGVMSSLIGIAARQSIETGKRVNIADLIHFPTTWKG